MVGSHVLKTRFSTRPSVSLSLAEAECYGIVKAMGVAIGQQFLLEDLGLSTDISLAIGIANLSGLCRLRHFQTRILWVQQQVRSGDVDLQKAKGIAR